ncbi:MAG: hypothetical protein J6X45_03785, partial [Lachnospiraceae bacterium]|nr:hypothetical protein [Lachnospiraceae bacterium]
QKKEIKDAINQNKYDEAVRLRDSGKYEEAKDIFVTLDNCSSEIFECTQAIKEEKYTKALKLYQEDGDFAGAYRLFIELTDYKDSKDKVLELARTYPNEILAIAEKGDTVVFGNYNGNTEWYVADKDGDKILLLSKYVIEKRRYNPLDKYANWEKCELKTWLNSTYKNAAFSADEQKLITDYTLTYDNGEEYVNQIYILSVIGMNKVIETSEGRKATLSDGTPAAYWLRGGLRDSRYVPYVDENGDMHETGDHYEDEKGVRPALWIDTSKLQ